MKADTFYQRNYNCPESSERDARAKVRHRSTYKTNGWLLETDAFLQRAETEFRANRREIVASDCFLNKQIRCHDSAQSLFLFKPYRWRRSSFEEPDTVPAWPSQISPGNALFTRYRTYIRDRANYAHRANARTTNDRSRRIVPPICASFRVRA